MRSSAARSGRLSAEDAARRSAARKDAKGRAQIYFLREWCEGRVVVQGVVREKVVRSTEQCSATSWMWVNRDELLLHFCAEGKPNAERYVDQLLRYATQSRRHPMAAGLPRQWLVYMSALEAPAARAVMHACRAQSPNSCQEPWCITCMFGACCSPACR